MAHKNENTNKHLFYLNELSDYKVASDDPDVRGWPVKDKDNRVVGKVDNLLVNKKTERVVYLDVEVDTSIIEADHDPYGQPANGDVHEFLNKEGETHIIIPVGLVRLNENNDNNFVYTDRINHKTFAETKRMQKGATVNREYEVVVLESYDRDSRNDNDQHRSTVERTSTDTSLNKNSNNRTTEERTSFDSLSDDRSTVSNRDHDSSSQVSPTRSSRDSNFSSEDEKRRNNDETYRSDRERGAVADDDSFYERREFDRKNYRRNS